MYVLWPLRSVYTSILHYLVTVVHKYIIQFALVVNYITLCRLKSVVSVKYNIYIFNLILPFRNTALCNVYDTRYIAGAPGTRRRCRFHSNYLSRPVSFHRRTVSLHPLFLTTHRAKINNICLYNIMCIYPSHCGCWGVRPILFDLNR